jgi:hypothetical protein
MAAPLLKNRCSNIIPGYVYLATLVVLDRLASDFRLP